MQHCSLPTVRLTGASAHLLPHWCEVPRYKSYLPSCPMTLDSLILKSQSLELALLGTIERVLSYRPGGQGRWDMKIQGCMWGS